MDIKPNMYGILPANVRYHEGLSSFAKVIFAEINALSNKNGFCFASNAYFGKVFSKSAATISRVLTELSDCGAVKIVDGEGGDLVRKITPCTPTQKLLGVPPQKRETPPRKNEEHNSTSYNTTSNVISKDITETLEENSTPSLPGKSPLQRVVNMYALLWKARYGTRPTINYPRAGKTVKSLLDSHGEYKVCLLLMQYFSWRGATNDDMFLEKRLQSNTYPLYWLPDYADPILAYIRNVIKLDVDSEVQVKKVVDAKVSELLTE